MLLKQGFEVAAIVCDGRRGFMNSLKDILVRMCQFHPVAIVRRYITKSPKVLASIELKELVRLLKHTDKKSFAGGLND